jgi:ubiquinone/menaquinone biosynthesis C-methylase UbiE
MSDLDGVRALYAQTAPRYETAISPAMDALARSLAAWMARCVRENANGSLHDPFDLPAGGACPSVRLALDIGTGSGVLARRMAGFARQVIGVDLSAPMLAVGRAALHRARSTNVRLVLGDAHRLPFRAATFDLIGASFGLNHSLPRRSLRELARLLRPNCLLCCQEWGGRDELSRLFGETFSAYTDAVEVDAMPALSAYLEAPCAWQTHLQDADDYYRAFKAAGFALVWAQEAVFATVRFPSVDAFIAYKLAWVTRRLFYEALSEAARMACYADLRAVLTPHCDSSGVLLWQPPLIRVCAVR